MSLFVLSLALSVMTGLAAYTSGLYLSAKGVHINTSLWTGLAIATVSPLGLVFLLDPVLHAIPVPSLTVLPELAILAGEGAPTVRSDPSVPVQSFALNPVWIVMGLWLAGAMMRLTYEGLREYRYAQLVWDSRQARGDLQDRVRQLASRAGLDKRVDVRVLDRVHTPFVCGVIWPVLILPAKGASDAVILHELAHIRRQDVAKAYLTRLIGCTLWFNPFWFAVERHRRASVELKADHQALSWIGPDKSRDYVAALIDAARNTHAPTPHPAFGTGDKAIIKMRIKAIMDHKPSTHRPLAQFLTVLAVGVVILPAAAAQAVMSGTVTNQPVTFTVTPVEGVTTSVFGYRGEITGLDEVPPIHKGHDIRAAEGTPVYAPADGMVTEAADADRYGYRVTIDHGQGFQTRYAHLQGFEVEAGDTVSAGEVIAYVGNTGASTGPHLHVEVFENGEAVDPALHLPGLTEE